MKNLLLFSCLLISLSFKAQGNLQFNQVLHLEITCCTASTFTVPVGKVWKIEGAMAYNNSYPTRITAINGNPMEAYLTGYTYLNYGILPIPLPYWLPTNTQVSFNTGSGLGQKGYVSIIEFNVIP
ncbi:MAG: hypothetical protein K9I37_06175 [Crocinitomicaceae bacterium]|nr:hypothetical protein [Crocinitomicaceae bacterium]